MQMRISNVLSMRRGKLFTNDLGCGFFDDDPK
jgi:hypothetical protein